MTPREPDVPVDPAIGPQHSKPGSEGDDPVSAEDRSKMGDTLDDWLHADAPNGGG